MAAIQRPVFQAEWNNANQHLKPADQTLLRKIARVAWNIFSAVVFPIGLGRLIGAGIGKIANRVLLPSAEKTPEEIAEAKRLHQFIWHDPNPTPEIQTIRNSFTAEECTVATPDGALLSATHFRSRNANAASPTMIYFQPNGTLKDQGVHLPLMGPSVFGTPANFVVFDYRTVGESRGTFKGAKDLEIDGSSIVQWVQKDLGVPAHQISFYGFSLGGAVAVKTQAQDPALTGPNGNERSFSSIKEMIRAILNKLNRFKWLASLIASVVKSQGYEMDVLSSYKKLQGRKLVIYHPEDPVIPYEASLKKGLGSIPHESLQLGAARLVANEHCAPLQVFDDIETGRPALDVVADFFFRPE